MLKAVLITMKIIIVDEITITNMKLITIIMIIAVLMMAEKTNIHNNFMKREGGSPGLLNNLLTIQNAIKRPQCF